MKLKNFYISIFFIALSLAFSNVSFASEKLLHKLSKTKHFATKAELTTHKQKLKNAEKVIKIVKITNNNIEVYKNLGQAYEAEFSSLTEKIPNEQGIFSLDSLPNHPYIGYLAYKHKNVSSTTS